MHTKQNYSKHVFPLGLGNVGSYLRVTLEDSVLNFNLTLIETNYHNRLPKQCIDSYADVNYNFRRFGLTITSAQFSTKYPILKFLLGTINSLYEYLFQEGSFTVEKCEEVVLHFQVRGEKGEIRTKEFVLELERTPMNEVEQAVEMVNHFRVELQRCLKEIKQSNKIGNIEESIDAKFKVLEGKVERKLDLLIQNKLETKLAAIRSELEKRQIVGKANNFKPSNREDWFAHEITVDISGHKLKKPPKVFLSFSHFSSQPLCIENTICQVSAKSFKVFFRNNHEENQLKAIQLETLKLNYILIPEE